MFIFLSMILHVIGIGVILSLTVAFALAMMDVGGKNGGRTACGCNAAQNQSVKKSLDYSPSPETQVDSHGTQYLAEQQKKAGGVTSVSQYMQ